MAANTLLKDAIDAARTGDVDGALAVLKDADPNEDVLSVMFMLLTAKARDTDALQITERALAVPLSPLKESTWRMRRGGLLLQGGRPEDARADFLVVLKLRASDDHIGKAQASLLDTVGKKRPPT